MIRPKIIRLNSKKVQRTLTIPKQTPNEQIVRDIFQFFKSKTFGIISLQGISQCKTKVQKQEIKRIESFLQRENLNYIKFLGRWIIRIKDTIVEEEISYFILNPKIDVMAELTRNFEQGTFIFSENGKSNLYYADCHKINLEADENNYGETFENVFLLKYKDFKFIYDKIIDFHFNFVEGEDIIIGDQLLVYLRGDQNEKLKLIDVDDVRPSAVINFERNFEFNTIKPNVFHFDEINFIIKISSKKNINSGWTYAKVISN